MTSSPPFPWSIRRSMQYTTLNIKAVSGPASITASGLSDVKEHLKVNNTYEDTLIQMYLDSAVHAVESYCQITIPQTTWELKLPHFPWDYRFIELPRGPVSSVLSMYYFDTDEVSTLWASSSYEASLDEMPARLYLQEGDSWEETYQRPDAVKIQYTAGYSTWAAVPPEIRQPIYYLVAHSYAYRQPVVTGTIATALPFALKASLQRIREGFNV